MRIRRSVSRFFGTLVVPAICLVITGYFVYHAVWGSRGVVELATTEARLNLQNDRLATIKDERERLQHRISLLEPGAVDLDMVEELARGQLQEGGPNQVSIPRNSR